jgi:hypothetical protein
VVVVVKEEEKLMHQMKYREGEEGKRGGEGRKGERDSLGGGEKDFMLISPVQLCRNGTSRTQNSNLRLGNIYLVKALENSIL